MAADKNQNRKQANKKTYKAKIGNEVSLWS